MGRVYGYYWASCFWDHSGGEGWELKGWRDVDRMKLRFCSISVWHSMIGSRAYEVEMQEGVVLVLLKLIL